MLLLLYYKTSETTIAIYGYFISFYGNVLLEFIFLSGTFSYLQGNTAGRAS